MQVTYDPMLDGEEPSQMKIWLKRIVILLVGLSLLAAIGYGISKLMSGGTPHKKQVTTIKLLPDTPPPPPPPPKEPPKEQPKQDQPKEMKVEQPKPVETPPAENLKMEGAAGDGPSPFAAGAVSNDYKGGDVKTIGSDGGVKFKWYASVIKSKIEDAIEKNPKLTEGQYKFVVSVWVKPNGDVDRLEWGQTDADPETVQALKEVLNNLSSIQELPPENMPQPVKLRISAKKIS